MVQVQETKLPGVGVRHDLITEDGTRIGVVFHRDGRREFFVCPADEPDSPSEVLHLSGAEAAALAEILGAPKLVERLAGFQQEVEGLAIDWVTVPESSPFTGGTIGDTMARRRTGVSIVAILRGGTAVPAPGPEAGLQAGDTLLVVGTSEGIDRFVTLLAG